MRDIFCITCVPRGIDWAIQVSYCPCLRFHEASVAALGFRKSPYRSHPGTIDQHDCCISIGERQKTVLSKINIKQFSRVAKIHLVNIVIDGFPVTRSKMGNGEPIISEAREPPLSDESH